MSVLGEETGILVSAVGFCWAFSVGSRICVTCVGSGSCISDRRSCSWLSAVRWPTVTTTRTQRGMGRGASALSGTPSPFLNTAFPTIGGFRH